LPLGAARFFWSDGGAIAGGCFPGGRMRARENETDCLRREIREELPKLKLGRLRLWKEVKAKNSHSGRKNERRDLYCKGGFRPACDRR
jgi:hypothetical protein